LNLFQPAQDDQDKHPLNGKPVAMNEAVDKYCGLTRSVSTGLSSLRASTPEVMKSFSELGRAATADGTLDAKTKELIAMALSVAARCDPCIGFHAQTLVKLGATRQELDEALGVTTYMGGGPSLMYAANAIAAFDEFSRAAAAKTV
jgi:AhpD family alkylhydroperoxidase